jgi:hypothetical protein
MATEALPIIFTKVEQRPSAMELLDAAVQLATHGGTLLTITSDDQARVAGQYHAEVQSLIRSLDEERLETTRGARETIERINARFNERINELRARAKAVAAAILTFGRAKEEAARREREEAERAQREKQLELEAEAKRLGLESPPAPPPIVVPPAEDPFRIVGSHGAVVGARDNWKWRVTDISKVPEAYLVPPEERVQRTVMNAAAKTAAKAAIAKLKLGPADKVPDVIDDAIPGIQLYNEPHLTSRVL